MLRALGLFTSLQCFIGSACYCFGNMAEKKRICGLFVCLALFAVAGSQSNSKEKEDSLGDKVQRLTEWNNKKSILRLDETNFRLFIETAPRNYSVIVMMTALRQCSVCKDIKEEFQILANSWRYSQQYSNHLFFAMVDFDEGPGVFKSLKLNFVPVIIHFSASGKPKKDDTMDIAIGNVGFAAEQIARWVAERTDIQIHVFRPPNYLGILALALFLSLVGGLLYMKRHNLIEYLYNKNCWGFFALAAIFVMTSGQMWNHIRKTPMLYKNPQTGQIHYIHPNNREQFIMETYIIMVLNFAVVVGFILLNEANTLKINPGKRRILALVGLGCVAFFSCLLLSVFRFKHQDYPYSFLFT